MLPVIKDIATPIRRLAINVIIRKDLVFGMNVFFFLIILNTTKLYVAETTAPSIIGIRTIQMYIFVHFGLAGEISSEPQMSFML